jgi:glycosyltransferase involved in cell wall biosynthesis
MKLHTTMISYQRLEATQRSIASYLEKVSVPFTLTVVDNGSSQRVREWLQNEYDYGLLLLEKNRYPGFACNRGWEQAPADATHFHRADNDFIYRDGWCEEVAARFSENPKLGQLGLLTDEQEAWAPSNVGGNCVIRRELWEKGLRYNETPWPDLPAGWSEDSYMSPAVEEMGYEWDRVEQICIDGITTPDPKDRYYLKTYHDRRILSILKSIK